MKTYTRLTNGLHKVSNVFVWISGAILFGISALIFIDVLMRYIFNSPITGSQEIVELAIVLVLYLGLPYSTYARSHVRVDALINTFSPKGKLICLGIVTILCAFVSGPIAVQLFRQAGNVFDRGTASAILKLAHYPFYYCASFGNALLTFEFIADGIRYFIEASEIKKEKEEVK